MSALDNFLSAYFHATDLAEKGADKTQHEQANELLIDHERTFLANIELNTEDQRDSDAFDRILELVEAYRKDESQYQPLVDYVEAIRKK
jgi:hypothetical protein